MSEPGLDLHAWESRWESVADVRDDDPDAALSVLTDLVEASRAEVEDAFANLDELHATIVGQRPEA
jgi:hypothetical protein